MKKAQLLVNKYKNIKTLPHVALRLSQLISDEGSAIREFEDVIRLDPTLVLRLLRLVNSSYFGLYQKVKSISKAVIFVGTKNLRNMILIEAVKDIFKDSGNGEVFSRTKLWLHCAAVSVCARMISERIFEQQGEDAFLAGTLHDIGLIVEDQVAGELLMQVCREYNPDFKSIVDYENEIIGSNHCMVGYLLARDWKLPVPIQEGIKEHHNVLKPVLPSSVTGVVQIADYIVSKINYPAIPKMEERLSESLAAHMKEMAGEYQILIKDLPDEMERARELYESEPE
ncbi:MAG: HDOD domain-containing protein [Deltaproteobacteria bacterium]|nr:HDOD domain-containing protein [Deltaproteobacteria bacterium]